MEIYNYISNCSFINTKISDFFSAFKLIYFVRHGCVSFNMLIKTSLMWTSFMVCIRQYTKANFWTWTQRHINVDLHSVTICGHRFCLHIGYLLPLFYKNLVPLTLSSCDMILLFLWINFSYFWRIFFSNLFLMCLRNCSIERLGYHWISYELPELF